MKNATKFILVILCTFICINASGQILIKSGLSYSSFTNIINGQRFNTPEFKTGFHIGIFKEEAIFKNLFLEAGPRLQIKGSNFNYPYTGTITTAYLVMPVLAKLYFDLNDDIFFYTATGAYLGVGIVGEHTTRHEELNNKNRLE